MLSFNFWRKKKDVHHQDLANDITKGTKKNIHDMIMDSHINPTGEMYYPKYKPGAIVMNQYDSNDQIPNHGLDISDPSNILSPLNPANPCSPLNPLNF